MIFSATIEEMSAFRFKQIGLIGLISLIGLIGGVKITRASGLIKVPNNLGLVRYWSMEDGIGTKATDFSGNGNTGTLTSGPTWSAGKFGKGILFDDASSQYVTIGSATVSDYPFTMCAWFNTDDATINQTIMSIGVNGSASNRLTLLAAGSVAGDPVRMDMSGSQGDTTTGFMVNTWYHACASATSATNRTVYINGGSATNKTTSQTLTGLNQVRIGISH